MRRLQIFFRLKWEEITKPIIEHWRGILFCIVAVPLGYSLGIGSLYLLECKLLDRCEDVFRPPNLALAVILGFISCFLLAIIILIVTVFVDWIRDNWKEAGRILEEEKKPK